ncbi:helix-turn-helix transcriptional regulator [Tindallia californiensis]|uniref:AraC-type DNA-binding protein n=1 Tax=Tindallia californiensis TaxID=159292 RepID=A0A1H3P6S2_9FIRM|nr:helix-turn-helix transcriptional regulator [Tindallia californiensis]SDY96495.1 AraC-type DNA-binding protein [Tindallia californiensis]
MVIRCGIIGNIWTDWLDEWSSHHKNLGVSIDVIPWTRQEQDDFLVKHLASRYDLLLIEEEIYFSLERPCRLSMVQESITIISGNSKDYRRVRRVFLEGCFDYMEAMIPATEIQELFVRLSGYFLQNERDLIQMSKKIAEEIAAPYPKSEPLFFRYWTLMNQRKEGAEDQFPNYAKAIERIIQFLPLHSIREKVVDFAQGAAEWIEEAEYPQEQFIATLLFIQQAYRDIFLPHAQHPLVRRAISIYLDKEFDLETVQDIADQLFVNRSHLSKTFITESGVSLTRYMMRTKIYGARYLLLDSKRSVYDVMDYLNYTDYGHFRKTFKKYTGMTPSEYVTVYRERFSIEGIKKI